MILSVVLITFCSRVITHIDILCLTFLPSCLEFPAFACLSKHLVNSEGTKRSDIIKAYYYLLCYDICVINSIYTQ